VYRVTPYRLAKALARDGLAHVLRAILRRVEVPEAPAPRPPKFTVTVYGESGKPPLYIMSSDPDDR